MVLVGVGEAGGAGGYAEEIINVTGVSSIGISRTTWILGWYLLLCGAANGGSTPLVTICLLLVVMVLTVTINTVEDFLA